jgi:hypothetical protein
VPSRGTAQSGEPAGERDTLTSYLRDYRLTLELKCSGLDAAGMACRSVPPSTLSLCGLVLHLIDVERNWFRRVLAGQVSQGEDVREHRVIHVEAVDRDTVVQGLLQAALPQGLRPEWPESECR